MINRRETVFSTRWFEVEARHKEGETEPYYSLKLPDYVAVVAYTAQGDVVLVRQYRPAIDAVTLELPSGLVDGADGPEATARRELAEETGYEAGELIHLGTLYPDVGRLQNRLHCYLAGDVRPIPNAKVESGIETVIMPAAELVRATRDGRFPHGLHLAALQLASIHERS